MKQTMFIVALLLCSKTFASDTTGAPFPNSVPACTCYSDRILPASRPNGVCVLTENDSCETNDGVTRRGWAWAACGKVSCLSSPAPPSPAILVEQKPAGCSTSNKCSNGQGPCSFTKQCQQGTHCIARQNNPSLLGYDVGDLTDHFDFCGKDYVAQNFAFTETEPTTSSSGVPAWAIVLILISSLTILALVGYYAAGEKYNVRQDSVIDVDDVRRGSLPDLVHRDTVFVMDDDVPRNSVLV